MKGVLRLRGFALLSALVTLALVPGLSGCKKSEPEPNVPGYYTGPMKTKGEVAPGPGAGQKAGSKAAAATEQER